MKSFLSLSRVSRNCLTLLSLLAVSCAQGRALTLSVSPAGAGTVLASWDANTELDLASYRLSYGLESRVYSSFLMIPASQTSQRVSGLEDNTLWFFALSALDTAGNESGFSEEVSFFLMPAEPDTVKPRPAFDLTVNGKADSVTISKGDTLTLEFKTSRLLTNGTLVSKDSLFFKAWILFPEQGWRSITDEFIPAFGLDRIYSVVTFPTNTPFKLVVTIFCLGEWSEDSEPVVVTFLDSVNIFVKVKIIL